jgi:putative peptidoglycan lipid II flippase
MTMLSRITGLLRESLFARAFGASAYTDAFIVAFRLPNLLRRLFAEGRIFPGLRAAIVRI